MVGWFGGGVGDESVAAVLGEIGAAATWIPELSADESSITFDAKGGPVEARGRVPIKAGFGRWTYNRILLQVSGVVGTAPDFDVDIPLPSTITW